MYMYKIMLGSEYGYNEKCFFGQFFFDIIGDIFEVIYCIINIDNVVVNEFIWWVEQFGLMVLIFKK